MWNGQSWTQDLPSDPQASSERRGCRLISIVYTVEPQNKGHFGANSFVPCREVVPISEGPLSEVPLYTIGVFILLANILPSVHSLTFPPTDSSSLAVCVS